MLLPKLKRKTVVVRNRLEIRHAMPGRIRFKIFSIRFNKDAAFVLTGRCQDITGVAWARANHKCGSVVIGYDRSVLPESSLVNQIREIAAPGYEDKKISCKTDACACAVQHEETSVKSAFRRFAGLTALTGIVFVREVLMKAPLAQSLFSPLGIVTTLFALPLVKRGIDSIRKGLFTLESFLGGTIVIAAGAGEAAAALEILWITSGAELLTAWSTERSRRAIRDILEVTAKNTYILVDGVEVEVPVDQVQPGDIVAIHTGEKISVDGVITEGKAMVDEASINGRAEFVLRQAGQHVFAGTFVREGVIFVRAEKVGDDTYLSRILKMVEDSLENKAPIEGVAEDLARKLIRAGFAATFLTFALTLDFARAFTVMLVMACPCATILSASTAISAALSAAARRRILIKGGRYLESAGQADTVCFDKTGTLTTNQPEVRELYHMIGGSEEKLLRMACSAERHNSHPVALAIKAEAERRGIDAIPHDVCEYKLGRGIRAEIEGKEVLAGSAKLMREFGVNIGTASQVHERFIEQGLTTVFVAQEGKVLGIMGFANKERQNIKSVVEHLQANGVRKIAMITGDEECTARNLTEKLNINECYHSVMPEEKSGIVNRMKADGHQVLMVGDGINDALALAEADIGVAMGAGGSEVAIEAADIALVEDDLKGVVYVQALSRQTMKVVNQNFWIATGSNIAGVAMGALGILSPVMAAFVHIVHTVGILANSSRLLGYNGPELPDPSTDENLKNRVKVFPTSAAVSGGSQRKTA